MPSPRPSTRRPDHDPLANLPRPLSERQRGGRARRVLGLGLVAAVLVAGVVIVRPGFGTGASGDVQGAVVSEPPAVASATPAPVVAAAEATETPSPTEAPAPTEAPLPTPIPPAELTGYQWPLPRGRLTLEYGPSPWGSRIVEGEPFHDGVDLATFCGDRIVAAHAGTVLAAGRHYDQYMGWVGDLKRYTARLDAKKLWSTLPIVVVIDDGNGYRSMYAHFGKVKVKKDQVVQAGQLIGWEGATGRASGCHLHYGLFSPLETATFGIDKDVVKRMKLPDQQIARIDPMLVLPDRPKPTKQPVASPTVAP